MKPRHTLLLAVLVTLSMTVSFVVFGFLPLHNKHQQAETALLETEKSIGEMQERMHRLPIIQEENRLGLAEWSRLSTRLVDADSVSYAIAQMNALCRKYQVKLKRVTLSSDSISQAQQPGEFSSPLTLLLQMEGRFLDFGMMLDDFPKMSYFFQITDFHLSKSGNRSELHIEARAAMRLRKEPS